MTSLSDMNIIRTFRFAYEEYRVVQTEDSSIKIQRLNEDMEMWEHLLRFDALASAFDVDGHVGDFYKFNGLWVFAWKDGSKTYCESYNDVYDGLIESQIQIFKLWMNK